MSKKPKKADKNETDQRVKEICDLKLVGYTRHYILRYAMEKWGIGPDRTDQLISEANHRLKEINLASVQDNMALIASNLWDLFRKAAQEKNIPEQHKILMSLAKLKGLDQYTVNHIIEDKRELADLSNEDLDKLLEEADARH